MASSMVSTASVGSINRATQAQASMVAPFTRLRSTSTFPVTSKTNADITSLASTKGRALPPLGKKKFETLSYLPDLSREQLLKEHGFVYRENHRSTGYYDGRYWTMWELPMFGCTDASQVLKELDEAIKAYSKAFIRIIGFDNKRQVQCISFITYKPPVF
ncbi:hypothetical protein SCA6_003660 [Theobroma cacao]